MRPEEALALLRWQIAIGADEAISDIASDRTAIKDAAPPPVPPPAGSPGVRPVQMRDGLMRDGVTPIRAPAPVGSPAGASSAEIAAAAGDIAALAAAVAAFEGCALRRTATNLVFADGNPAAPVMLIGEAPGAEEDRQGKPFVGASGQLLDRMLATIGLDRKKAYITNILPWRPPGNRKPTAAEIAMCLPFVRRHVELVAPRLLIFVGGTAASSMLDRNEGIMRLRGRWYQYPTDAGNKTIDAICIFHPAFLLRSPGQKREAWRDLLAIASRLGTAD